MGSLYPLKQTTATEALDNVDEELQLAYTTYVDVQVVGKGNPKIA